MTQDKTEEEIMWDKLSKTSQQRAMDEICDAMDEANAKMKSLRDGTVTVKQVVEDLGYGMTTIRTVYIENE